jgi:transposase InsO family protein
MDFKVVTTLFGKTYYLLFFIAHHSRKIIHYNITDHPTKEWIEHQLRNFTFNFDFDKKIYLIRDNDQLYKHVDFQKFNIEDVPISRRAPDMNAIMERFIGSFKREALNFFVIINRKQLEYIAKNYIYFYNNYRPHQGLGNVTIPEYLNVNEHKIYSKKPKGKIMKQEFLNGVLNHYYYKQTA